MPEHPQLCAAALVLALCVGACGGEVQPEARVALAENPLVPSEGKPRYALEPLGLITPISKPGEPAEQLPELPFQEVSDGLPPSGSWSGRPLLLEFPGEVHGLVASNCEEQGYSCWIAPSGPGQTWQPRDEGLPRDLGCAAACAADLDRDGSLDLVLSTSGHGARVYLGLGAQGWRQAEPELPDSAPVADFAFGDLDGDGTNDLAGIGYPRGGLLVFLGEHGGLRAAPELELLPDSTFGRALELADLDLDGRADLIVATGEGVRVFLTQASKPLHWLEQSQGLPAPSRPDSVLAICVGRFTADPRPQIAICCQPDTGLAQAERDAIGVYGWNAAKNAWEHIDTGLPRGERYSDLCAADFDGDEKLDLVTLSLEHGAAIYLGDGKGGFQARGRLAGVHGRGHLAVGHVDGNLLPDIVVAVPASSDQPDGGGLRAFQNRRAIWTPR